MSTQSSGASERLLWSVDSVRAWGVLGVVLAHGVLVIERAHALHQPAGRSHVPVLGLDVFFVLSGFLVWRLTRDRPTSPFLFLLHRVTRIAPLYTLLTLAFVVFMPLAPYHIGLRSAVTPEHLLLSLLYIPHRAPNGGGYPVLQVGWTLVYDMYFFALFAGGLAAPRRWRLAAITLLLLTPFALHLFVHGGGVAVKTYTNKRCLSFLAGVWLAELAHRRLTLPLRPAVVAAFGSLAGYLALYASGTGYHGWGAALWIGVAALAVYGTVSAEAAGARWMRLPFCGVVGRWSYAIYLAQTFAIPLAVMWTPGPDGLRLLSATLASIALGAALCEAIELPINRLLRVYEQRRGWRPARAALAAP